jgi:dCMP deaminase
VGAIIVRDRAILSTGYNGAPSGIEHCKECRRKDIPSGEKLDLCMAVHSEQNAIIQAAKHGVNIDGSDLFCTLLPCPTCFKMIINAGIQRVYFQTLYGDEKQIRELWEQTKIDILEGGRILWT